MSGMLPPDALRDRIRAAVAATPASTFGRGQRLGVALGCVLLVAAIGVALLRRDVALLPVEWMVTVTLGLVLLSGGTLFLAFAPGRRGLGLPVFALVAATLLTPAAYAILTATTPHGHGTARWTSCFAAASGCGVLALAGLTAALRRAVPAAPVARGALLGACAGAWSGLVQHLHCPSGDRLHILIAHAVPIALFAAIGAVVTPRHLRP